MKKAKTKFKLCILTMSTLLIALIPSFVCSQDRQEQFIYDAKGKRDPFIPLLDKDSATGLRASFTSPKLQVKLPVEIKVSGILWNGKEYFAVINDEVMKEGEDLGGGIRLKEIEKDKVILKYGQREFTVFLKGRVEK